MTRQLFDDNYKSKPKCHTGHPILKLGNGEILGASCGQPRPGFDIYIGFDYGMKFNHTDYPWNATDSSVVEVQYRITDMCAPKSPKEFKKMIAWMAEQLTEGKRIHIGCIGGHGRTGTVLAALVAYMKPTIKKPIQWVRKNHCKKAVESRAQIKFLMKHFGCEKAEPTKQGWSGTGKSNGAYSGTETGRLSGKGHGNVTSIDRARRLKHVAGKGSIWG